MKEIIKATERAGYVYCWLPDKHGHIYEIMYKDGSWKFKMKGLPDEMWYRTIDILNVVEDKGFDIDKFSVYLSKAILTHAVCTYRTAVRTCGQKAVDAAFEGWGHFDKALTKVIDKVLKKPKLEVVDE